MTREIHHHCQCDFCDGVDCGQDDPEERQREEKARQDEHDAAIRKAERARVLNEIIASFDEHGCPFTECTEERYQKFDMCRECIFDWLKSLRGGER